jgi:DUF1016 N-terminal domain
VVAQANSTLTLLFWHTGNRITTEILKKKRADYDKQIVSTLSTQLKDKCRKKFELRNVQRMMQFAELFQDFATIVPLSQQLSWSQFVELLPLKTGKAKLFYTHEAATLALGIRDLRKQISTKTI